MTGPTQHPASNSESRKRATCVDPCYHSGTPEHTFARGCPGHPHTGLIPEIADWLDRLDEGDPAAVEGLNRLLGGDPDDPDNEPILSPEVMRQINREIEEGQRIRARGAAAGGNYLIGSRAPFPDREVQS